jgi:hypothetical protein
MPTFIRFVLGKVLASTGSMHKSKVRVLAS